MPAPIRPRLRLAAGAAVSCLALVGLAACGGDAEDDTTGTGGTQEPTTSQEPSTDAAEETDEAGTEGPEPIRVTVEGGSIQPAGERVQVALGEPVVVEVTSDRAGELHVHSTPEQEISFGEGTSEHEIVIDVPGVVEVESHDPDLVVLQLEVR